MMKGLDLRQIVLSEMKNQEVEQYDDVGMIGKVVMMS
jgi:hypothetical protein